jgi:hypothetical protein
MRRAAKIDQNQPAIVEALRADGWSVQSLAQIGKGCPDLLISRDGETIVVECKMPGERLNKDQLDWLDKWQGIYVIATDPADTVAEVHHLPNFGLDSRTREA